MLTQTPSQRGLSDAASSESGTSAEYLLVCEARATSLDSGSWRFSLESFDGTPELVAGDEELGDLNRLTLLAAVRGLEAIDGPASITLLSSNRYLIRSLSESLPRWRNNGFVWEHFGRRIEVQHGDLWRRIDRALSIHRVEACLISSRLVSLGRDGQQQGDDNGETRQLRVDTPHLATPAPPSATRPKGELRRWLMNRGDGQSTPLPRRRFTASDLLEAS